MTTREPIILLCPGQGAQRVGMGHAWASDRKEAAAVFASADAVLGDSLGQRLSALCFAGAEERINRTDVAQPALYTTAIASWRAWSAADAPTVLAGAGLSLGEYTALHLAGAISFEDGLKLVALRGAAMQAAAEASDGGMLALIGADEQQARQVCADAARNDALVPANFNAPGQIVLSGHAAACERAAKVAESLGLRATRLAVAGAFHSPLMAPAAEKLSRALESVHFSPPSSIVVSNVTAKPHTDSPEQIKARLVEQLTAPVRWDASCAWLAANVKTPAGAPAVMHELAPGKVLAGLMRRIDRTIKVETHDEPGA